MRKARTIFAAVAVLVHSRGTATDATPHLKACCCDWLQKIIQSTQISSCSFQVTGMSSARLSRVQQAAALSDIDKRISNRIFSNGSCVPRWLYKLLEYGGDGFVWLAITVSAVLLPSTPMTTRALWSNFLLGLIVDLILVGVVKGVCRRKRPVYNNMKDFLVVVSVDNFSFPSGHSSR